MTSGRSGEMVDASAAPFWDVSSYTTPAIAWEASSAPDGLAAFVPNKPPISMRKDRIKDTRYSLIRSFHTVYGICYILYI